MDEQLKNMKFSTKSVMITNKQKEYIETLLDELMDYGDYNYNKIEYWKLSKQDATELIKKLKSLVEDYRFDFLSYDYECGDRD